MIISKVDKSIQAALYKNIILGKRTVIDSYTLEKRNIAGDELQHVSWIITRWILPISGRYRLNSDGCCMGNPGVGGGIVF